MTDHTAVAVLVPGQMNPDTLATLKERFRVIEGKGRPLEELPEAERQTIRGAALAGTFTEAQMALLPNLEMIAHFGVGYDGVDAKAAARRGIAVSNTPDVLTDEVADTALGLLLMTVRELPQSERYLRAGRWQSEGPYPLTPTTLRGRTAGIMGLGRIGLAIARRLEAFGVTVAYHNRTRRNDVPYAYHGSLKELAAAVDTLIIAAPGGAGTKHAVDAAVLEALGPDGVLINIGRGSSVDEAALAEALRKGTILAAGLDVFEHEPKVAPALLDLPNAVLLPHVASASRATRREMGALVVANLDAWFSGHRLPTAVPESVEAGLTNKRT